MYKDNKIYIKLPEGILNPFTSTISVKQGFVFSPLLFNIYIDKICGIFYQLCCPVKINSREINCLLWADDLLLISETESGSQNWIDKMHIFYQELGLKINIKKTKIIIFNKRGLTLDDTFFKQQRIYLSEKSSGHMGELERQVT